MKIEKWNGHDIRFIEKDGEWWAVAKDVAEALGYKHTPHMTRLIDEDEKDVHKVDTLGGKQEITILSESGVYEAIFNSNKNEAKEFKKWVKLVIKELRKSIGLEGFNMFRLLDKEHQKEAMSNLSAGLTNPVRINFIKANTITNKAVSTMYGYKKMVKKDDMTPEMLIDRQPILNDTIDLMIANEKFNLGISVSDKINEKYNSTNKQ